MGQLFAVAIEADQFFGTPERDDDGMAMPDIADLTRVRLEISGGAAASSDGRGWAPFECDRCGRDLETKDQPCPDCENTDIVPTPLYWASSAEIIVDPEAEMVQLRLHLLSGGFLQMEIHRSQDGKRLIVRTPRAGLVPVSDATITQIYDGTYEIKE